MPPIISEAFTAADNTNLNGFGSWSAHPISLANLFIFSNKVTKDNQSGAALVMHSSPVAGDGYVQAPLSVMSVLSINAALVISLDPVSNDYIWARHNSGTDWTLRSTVAGTATTLGTFNETLVAGDTRLLRIERRVNGGNTEYRVLVGGVERIPWTVSNSQTGTRVGIRYAGAASSTTGYSIDDFEAGVFSPNAPSNLVPNAVGPTQVNLTWTDNSNNEDSFRVERKTGSGGTYAEIGSVGTNVTSFSDTTAAANTTYFYRVRSRNTAGDSAYLTEQSVTTPSGGAPPAAPLSLVLIALSEREVMAVWTDNSNNESSFRVERKTGVGGGYAEIGSTGTNISAFYDTTVSPGTVYFYRVRARNSNGDSAYLTEQSVTTPAAGTTLTVWEANLQHGIGTDSTSVANYARQLSILTPSADIICVSERTDSFNGWAAGLTAAGYTEVAYRKNGPGQDDGSAIWIKNSTVTLVQAWDTMLSTGAIGWDGSTNVDKAAVAAKVTVGGKTFIIVSTHLAWSAGADAQFSTFSAIRVAQIQTLLSWIDNTIVPGALDVLIAGDMNFGPDYPKSPSGFQIDAFLVNYTDLWASGLGTGKSSAPWGDRDGNAVADMPLGSLTTRTHDTRRIDYFFLKTNSQNLSFRNITLPDLRVLCPHALSGFVCTPEVVETTGTPDDMGVRPSDHNWLKATFNLLTGPSNLPPTANAGTDQNLPASTTQTTLIGTASDPDGTIASVNWAKLSGPAGGVVSSPSVLTTQVTSLTVGVYTFRLTVIDNLGASSFDDIVVRINSAPTVNAGNNQSIQPPTSVVTLTGTASDLEGDTLTKTWSLLSGPNSPTIVSPSALTTNVTGLIQGIYIFRLTVSDGINPAVTDDIQVTVSTNLPPTINAGPDQNLAQSITTIVLNGFASDPENDPLTVTWSRVSGPNTPTIVSPNSLITNVTGAIPGTYVFRLSVSDGINPTLTDDVTVKINRAPICNAGGDQTLAAGITTVTLTGTASDPDGDPLIKIWSRVSGPTIPTILTPDQLSTQVTGLIPGVYTFQLTVSDGVNPSVSDLVVITAVASASSLDIMPNFWSWKAPIQASKDVFIFRPYYGPSQTRTVGAGDSCHNWELSNDDSSHENFLEIRQFHDEHYPGVKFYMYDPQLNETRIYEIDSDFAYQYNHQDSYAWSFRIKESFPYTVIVGPPS